MRACDSRCTAVVIELLISVEARRGGEAAGRKGGEGVDDVCVGGDRGLGGLRLCQCVCTCDSRTAQRANARHVHARGSSLQKVITHKCRHVGSRCAAVQRGVKKNNC